MCLIADQLKTIRQEVQAGEDPEYIIEGIDDLIRELE